MLSPTASRSRGLIPKRGEIWWVHLDPTVGSEIRKTRPCLVLTSDVLNERRRTVVVVPLSSSPVPNPPLLAPIVCENRHATAVLDQIRAVSKERMKGRIAMASAAELSRVETGLREILDL